MMWSNYELRRCKAFSKGCFNFEIGPRSKGSYKEYKQSSDQEAKEIDGDEQCWSLKRQEQTGRADLLLLINTSSIKKQKPTPENLEQT